MKRIQVQSTAKPNSNAQAPAIASIATGLVKRRAINAPSQSPTWEAAHAQPGVSSQPRTTSRCANHLGTVRYPLRLITMMANTIIVTTNPAPAATGKYTKPLSPNPSAPPRAPASGEMASD